ncbi:MAG: MFS transporter [Betaproteobacteria bacterium]|nr:MFS transporter [Betaproteobacteria bacterium]MDH5578190.1 MFS transporter [Betaproteobacteria bacterium]
MPPSFRLSAYFGAYFLYAGAFVPYFALYLAARGFGAVEIAAVMAMPQLARVAAPTFWGWLADRSGAGRAIVIGSGLALVAGYPVLAAAQGALAVALVMLLMSLLSAGALPIVEAMTLNSLEGRGERYGPIRMWGSIGFIAGVLGTGVWLDAHAPQSLLGVVVLLAAVALAVSTLLPTTRVSVGAGGAEARLGDVLRRVDVIALLAACSCMSAAHGALYGFFSLHAEALGYSKTAIGALWTLGVLAEIVVFLAWPKLTRRYSLRVLLIASFVCAAARFAAIGWGTQVLLLLVAAQLLHAATFGVFHAASVAAVHRLFTGRLQARGQTLYSSLSYGLGGGAGLLVAGWSWEALGPGWSFTLSSVFALAGAALVTWRVRV